MAARSPNTRAPIKLYDGDGYESSSRTQLRWMRFYRPDGPCTLTLELPAKRLRSKPVTVQVSSQRVTPDAIVFEMEPY